MLGAEQHQLRPWCVGVGQMRTDGSGSPRAYLGEDMAAESAKGIRTNTVGADICATTARGLSRHTGYDATIGRALLQACAMACTSCGRAVGDRGRQTSDRSRTGYLRPGPAR